jgi:hypothetical protein
VKKPKHNGFIKVYLNKKSPCERPYDIITVHIASGLDTNDESIYHITPDEAMELAIKLMLASSEYMTRQNKEYITAFIKPRT